MTDAQHKATLAEAHRREQMAREEWLRYGRNVRSCYRHRCRRCQREFFSRWHRAARCCDCRLRRVGKTYRPQAPRPQKAAPHAKLGKLQKDILRAMLKYMSRANPKNKHFFAAGVQVRAIRPRNPSASNRAAFSRAIAHLEGRGLVMRDTTVGSPNVFIGVRPSLKAPAPRRTEYLLLTPAGEEIAKRLTSCACHSLLTVSTEAAGGESGNG